MNQLIRRAHRTFCDSIRLRVCGGTGGTGLPQYGGIGGKGGDVYVQGSPVVNTLAPIKRLFPSGVAQAPSGQESRRTYLLGQSGSDLVIKVPTGVTVADESNQVLGEINSPTDKIIVAQGGRGGDKFNDSHGFTGQKRLIRLELKLISDTVFVGFPNAGKSTLLRAVSRAKPKVAEYPFTTLRPNLGIALYPDERRITMADLPGLVEGAHKNLGLGCEFLRHTVRSKLLLFLVDIGGVDLGPRYPNRSALETICILNKEIELYDDTILNKPAILAISKVDTEQQLDKYKLFLDEWLAFREDPSSFRGITNDIKPSRLLQFDDVLPISSSSRFNIDRLKNSVRCVLDKYAEAEKLERDKFSTYEELLPHETNRLTLER